MNRNLKQYGVTILGLILLGTGLILIKTFTESQGIMRALPYIFVGVGCGIFGQGMGNIISGRVMKNNPALEKQMEIDKNDERNISIETHAKAKAYDMMVFVFGSLMLSFALMGIDMAAVLLLVSAYVFVVGYGIYYRCRYDKEM